jgi:hypothetical protein
MGVRYIIIVLVPSAINSQFHTEMFHTPQEVAIRSPGQIGGAHSNLTVKLEDLC